jgi:type IV pilus assembly protein PilW
VELLVAIALGMVIMTALVALYGSMSRTNNEMAKTNQLIENGRFAVQLLQADLVHAGFWGAIDADEDTPALDPLVAADVPTPCLAYSAWPADAAARALYTTNLLAIPVEGYTDGSTLNGCGVSNVVAASDVLLVRHASTKTCVAGSSGCAGPSDSAEPHIQLSGCRTGAAPDGPSYLLDGAGYSLRRKDCATVAPLRKINQNIYYVANNTLGVPTLMRVSFDNGAYSSPQPLIEGIQAFQVEFGIDSMGSNGLPISATNPGDGNADVYEDCGPCTFDQLQNVVAVKVHVLARNLEPTAGYTDNKVYQLGSLTVNAANDHFKRHVFSTTVRLVNPSSRRETVE